MTEGETEYARSLVLPGSEPRRDLTADELKAKEERTANYKSLGLSDGQADFAADMKLPG
jgi:hypothetical protein